MFRGPVPRHSLFMFYSSMCDDDADQWYEMIVKENNCLERQRQARTEGCTT